MNTTRRWTTAAALAAIFAMGACCNAPEERAVTFSAPDSLTITRDGVARKFEVVTRLTQHEVDAATFEYVFDAIEGDVGGDGVALTLSGSDLATNEVLILVLALPASLRRGDEYPIGATFEIEAGEVRDPRAWGAHDLRQSDQAEVAFTMARYTFPPPAYTPTFRAASASGTIRITDRQRGWVMMTVNLNLVDAGGRTTTVTGRAQASLDRFTPSCT